MIETVLWMVGPPAALLALWAVRDAAEQAERERRRRELERHINRHRTGLKKIDRW